MTNGVKINIPFMLLRKGNGYTQATLGEQLGYHKETIANVEAGKRTGTVAFWRAVQDLYNVPDADMWALINGIEARNKPMI